jgi:hypothetical protein
MKKRIIFLMPVIFAGFQSVSQVSYVPPTARSFSIGIGGGIIALQGDIDEIRITPGGRANLDYNITPYISLGVEGQMGKLSAGAEVVNGRYTRASFYAANVNARFASGQFFRKKLKPGSILGGLYIGAGAGVVNSEIDKIGDRYKDGKKIKGIVTDPPTLLAIPLNLGLNLELPRLLGRHNLVANINYQYNFVSGEQLDGYTYEFWSNLANDGYSFLSVGLRYNFGRLQRL